MPLRARSDPQLPDKMRQREHRNEATGVFSATFLNEAIRDPSCLSLRIRALNSRATPIGGRATASVPVWT